MQRAPVTPASSLRRTRASTSATQNDETHPAQMCAFPALRLSCRHSKQNGTHTHRRGATRARADQSPALQSLRRRPASFSWGACHVRPAAPPAAATAARTHARHQLEGRLLRVAHLVARGWRRRHAPSAPCALSACKSPAEEQLLRAQLHATVAAARRLHSRVAAARLRDGLEHRQVKAQARGLGTHGGGGLWVGGLA